MWLPLNYLGQGQWDAIWIRAEVYAEPASVPDSEVTNSLQHNPELNDFCRSSSIEMTTTASHGSWAAISSLIFPPTVFSLKALWDPTKIGSQPTVWQMLLYYIEGSLLSWFYASIIDLGTYPPCLWREGGLLYIYLIIGFIYRFSKVQSGLQNLKNPLK